MSRRANHLLLILTAAAIPRFAAADEPAPVDYSRDVKPLLAKHCVECHGPTKQQAGLRLDSAALAIQGGDSGPAIDLENAEASRILLAVTGESDEASQMPLDRPPLATEEIDLLRRWIRGGAPHPQEEAAADARIESDHWAFQPVMRPGVPAPLKFGASGVFARNPIDAFIQSRLADEGLTPAPEADRITLIRRVTLDLIGLLPTPEDVDAYLADVDPGAYERVVDRLLATPHYGERWGRHWLDAARYADSNGFTIDGQRSMWPYRDWVVGALNADMPFDRFTIEQLAGDLLPQPTMQQLVATGFHRNTLANEEGGTDDEQFRVESVVDRVGTTSTVWMGLTVACAQCHDHKYDPITQRDFYRLYAIFNNTADNNDAADLAPKIDMPTPRQAAERAELQAEIAAASGSLKDLESHLDIQLNDWAATLTEPTAVEWTVVAPIAATSADGATLSILKDRSVLVGGEIPAKDDYTVTLPLSEATVTAIRLETLTHESLPRNGPGLATNGNFVLGELSLSLDDTSIPLGRATADHSQDGHDVSRAIDGDPEQGWAINVKSGNMNVDRQAVFVLADPLAAAHGSTLTVKMVFRHPRGYQIGRFRLSVTSADPASISMPDTLRELAAITPQKRTEDQQNELTRLFREQNAQWSRLRGDFDKLESQLKALNAAIPASLVMRELDNPRETHIHLRGSFLQPGALVTPGVPAVLPGISTSRPSRLDLANWLVAPQHPLTARVTVNRIWQRYFGRGLVETENDFGLQGTPPTHPELLDWLASEFIREEWSIKSLHRLIVTSHTYRQSSHARPELSEVDPQNRLLARQSRLRLEAETIRDVTLAASGLLSHKMGGPPVHPPQPEGIYVLTQNVKPWPEAKDEDRYRRGIYTQFWRSSPHPMMPTFDAPDANTTCTRRVRSNTPLQALTLANDRSFVELAEGLAVRLLKAGPDYDEGRLRELFRITLSRSPSDAEAARMMQFVARQRKRFTAEPEAANNLTSQLSAGIDAVDAAIWTTVARVVLNLDELITRE